MKQQQTKKCSRCGFPQSFFAETWEKMELAGGKRYPTRHRGCGGEFVSLVSRIGGSKS
jgi:hypothetical protein